MDKNILQDLYIKKKLSSVEIAKRCKCSPGKVNYWLAFHKISKRTISEAIYNQKNPKGDPFFFMPPGNLNQMFLFGLGLGLFWGEGAKSSSHAVRLSNSDPELVKQFVNFLVTIYNADKARFRFQLLIYDDLNSKQLVSFWSKYLSVSNNQFSKTTILKKRGHGTYKKKMKHGVIIVHFGNMKLKKLISSQIANLRNL